MSSITAIQLSSFLDFFVVNDVLLSNSTLPNEGFVQIVTELNGNLSVCWQTLKNNADDVICRQVGYTTVTSHFNKPVTSGSTDKIFSGSIDCNGEEQDLSQCSITNSNQTCSELSYIKCKVFFENVTLIPHATTFAYDKFEQQS